MRATVDSNTNAPNPTPTTCIPATSFLPAEPQIQECSSSGGRFALASACSTALQRPLPRPPTPSPHPTLPSPPPAPQAPTSAPLVLAPSLLKPHSAPAPSRPARPSVTLPPTRPCRAPTLRSGLCLLSHPLTLTLDSRLLQLRSVPTSWSSTPTAVARRSSKLLSRVSPPTPSNALPTPLPSPRPILPSHHGC